MMELYKQLPHLEPYGDLQYFLYVIVATLPIFIGLFFKKRFALYEVLVSLFFIVTMLVGGKTNQISALILMLSGKCCLYLSTKGTGNNGIVNGYFTWLAFYPYCQSSL